MAEEQTHYSVAVVESTIEGIVYYIEPSPSGPYQVVLGLCVVHGVKPYFVARPRQGLEMGKYLPGDDWVSSLTVLTPIGAGDATVNHISNRTMMYGHGLRCAQWSPPVFEIRFAFRAMWTNYPTENLHNIRLPGYDWPAGFENELLEIETCYEHLRSHNQVQIIQFREPQRGR